MTFYRYFFPLELTKIADYTKRAEPAEPTRCKSPALRQNKDGTLIPTDKQTNPDFEAI